MPAMRTSDSMVRMSQTCDPYSKALLPHKVVTAFLHWFPISLQPFPP